MAHLGYVSQPTAGEGHRQSFSVTQVTTGKPKDDHPRLRADMEISAMVRSCRIMHSPSRITKRWRGLGHALASLLTVSCGPEEEDFPLPDVVWEGRGVRVRMEDPTMQVCGGTFDALDRHVELVREAMLLEGDGVVEYSIGDEDFVESACDFPFDGTSIACADASSGNVFTSNAFVLHEIVHAVRRRDPGVGLLSSPFEEGLAMVYGDDFLPSYPIPLDIVGVLDKASYIEGGEEYYFSGHMVAKLLDLHGMETFRRFDLQAREQGEGVAFSEVYGQTKREFGALAEGDPVCEQTQWWAPLLECDGEPMIADPATDGLVLSGDLSCAAEDVLGPGVGRVWTSRHFRLDRGTSTLAYEFDIPEDATLEIVSCDGGCPERFAYIGMRDDVGSVLNGVPSLEPGEYFLRVSRPVDEREGHFEIVLQ